MNEQKNSLDSLGSILLLIGVFLAEWFLFKSFIQREMAWSPFLNGDANWYLGHSYVVFDSILKNWKIPPEFFNDPAGFMVLLSSSVLYLFFGASRLTALSTNFIFYILWQGIMFYAIRYVTKSRAIAFAMLGLCLTAAMPFQGDKVHPMLNITEYQRDFIAFCLFGVFIAVVLFSDTFLKIKQSIIAGAVAGFMITFRYAMLFHLVGIYAATMTVFFVIFLLKRAKPNTVGAYKTRIMNGILSFLMMCVVSGYPIYLAKSALYHHYFAGKLIGPKNESFIKLYQQGVHDFVQQILYYPKMLLGSGLGRFFFIASLAALSFILLFIIISLVMKKGAPDLNKSSQPRSVYGLFPFSIFLFMCIAIPLFLLTAYPVRSGNVGLLIVAPSIMAIFILFTHLLNRFDIPEKRILSVLKVFLAVAILTMGMFYQVKSYAIVSLSSHNREDYLAVARLYEDIIAVSKKANLKQPRISVDFMENYVLGCGEAITAYRYEHAGELFRISQKLGSDIGAEVKEQEALNLLRESDIVLLSVREELLESRDPLYTDPLSLGMAGVPFSKSIKDIRPVLAAHVNKNFTEKGRYKVFNREIVLYLNNQLSFAPIAIRSSSVSSNLYSADSILKESLVVWHSESNPVYPQWLEFEYKLPVVITRLTMRCQAGGSRRAPSEFCFQGLGENGQWLNLLVVPNASFKDEEELKSWPVENIRAFKRYRIYITKNNGTSDFVTIAKVSFNYMGEQK